MQPNDLAAAAAPTPAAPTPAAPTPAAPAAGGYEFTQVENVTIQRTGRLAHAWGILSVALGIVMLGMTAAIIFFMGPLQHAIEGSLPGQAGLVVAIGSSLGPLALVNLCCGGFYIQAGGALTAVVKTQGDDITHMLRGLDALRFAFQVEAIAALVATVAGFAIGLATSIAAHH
jgi:hypothetical protein